MIKLDMFKALCTIDQVNPQFLHFIFGLGKKTQQYDENFMACYQQISRCKETEREPLVESRPDDKKLLSCVGRLGDVSFGESIP